MGEAPGETEQRVGEVFRGRAGKLQSAILEETGFKEDEEVFITNTILCRPPGNAKPKKPELEACRENIEAILKAVNPEIIIPVGAVAMKWLTGKGSGITKVHGSKIQSQYGLVVPTIHSAYALRKGAVIKPTDKAQQMAGVRGEIVSDFQYIRMILDGKEPDHSADKDYRLITTFEELEWVIDQVSAATEIAVDLETTGLLFFRDRVIGIAISWNEKQGVYIPIRVKNSDIREYAHLEHVGEYLKKYDALRERLSLPPADAPLVRVRKKSKKSDITISERMIKFWGDYHEDVWKVIVTVFRREDLKIYGWNFKFDHKFLLYETRTAGFRLAGDGMFMSYLLDENSPNDLKSNAYRAFRDLKGYAEELRDYISQSAIDEATLANAPLGVITRYACGDVDANLRLCRLYAKTLQELYPDLWRYHEEFYIPLHHIYAYAEFEGARVDPAWVEKARVSLEEERETIGRELFQILGEEFDPESKLLTSPQQLVRKIFGPDSVLKVPKPPSETGKRKRRYTTSTEAPSTNEVTIKELIFHKFPPGSPQNTFARRILEHKDRTKQLTTYIKGCTSELDPWGRVHWNMNLIGAVTGRFSAKRIPIQTIPRKPLMRGMFITWPGWYLIEFDYSQVELRIAAWYSQDPVMCEEFDRGEDSHLNTAMSMFNKPVSKISKEERKLAKSVNFGCVKEGSLVFIRERGLIPIEQVLPGDVSAFTEDKVTRLIDNGIKDFYLLETTSGHQTYVTGKHKMMTLNGLKAVEELCANDKLQLGLCEAHAEKDPSIPKIKALQKVKEHQVPTSMSEDLALWLGLWIAEGSIQEPSPPRRHFHHKVSFFNSNRDILDLWSSLSLKLFPNTYQSERDNSNSGKKIQICSSYVAEWLISLKTGTRSQNKTVPQLMFSSTKKVKAAFIRGLFEGDGTAFITRGKSGKCKRTRIRLSSVSRRLIEETQLLLMSFGIDSRISVKSNARQRKGKSFKGNYDSYVLSIKSRSVTRFIDEIGFISEVKRAKCIRGKTTTEGQSFARFRSITKVGEGRAFDLEVESNHTYAFDGYYGSNSLYEGGSQTLADSINSRRELDEALITSDQTMIFQGAWRNRYSAYTRWRKKVHKVVLKDKQVQSPIGRIRRLSNVDSEEEGDKAEALREGPNALIQGLGSDLAEFALARIFLDRFHGEGITSRFRWSLHDALFFEAPGYQVIRTCEIIQEEMERPEDRCPGLKTPVEFKVFKERWAGEAWSGWDEIREVFTGITEPPEDSQACKAATFQLQ